MFKRELYIYDEKTDCWNWKRLNKTLGYGVININGKPVFAHRLMYEKTGRKIPDNLELDHLCRNRACVNPDHLEAVTHKENIARSPIHISVIRRSKTHCKWGHSFKGSIKYKNSRKCRICGNECQKKYYLKKKSKKCVSFNK